jgi:hypothetical protein
MLSWWDAEGSLDRVIEPLIAGLQKGELKPVVADAFPFDRAPDAHRFIPPSRGRAAMPFRSSDEGPARVADSAHLGSLDGASKMLVRVEEQVVRRFRRVGGALSLGRRIASHSHFKASRRRGAVERPACHLRAPSVRFPSSGLNGQMPQARREHQCRAIHQ